MKRTAGASPPAWSCRAATPGEVGECLASFEAFARHARLPSLVRRDLAVVLDELLTNAARHALVAGEDAVEAELEQAGGFWELRLTDRGPAFDPLAAPPPAIHLPLAERVPGGVGIELVRQLADSVAYERRAGANRLRVRVRSC